MAFLLANNKKSRNFANQLQDIDRKYGYKKQTSSTGFLRSDIPQRGDFLTEEMLGQHRVTVAE